MFGEIDNSISEEIGPSKVNIDLKNSISRLCDSNDGNRNLNLDTNKNIDNQEIPKISIDLSELIGDQKLDDLIDVFSMKSVIGFDLDNYFLKIKIFFKNNFDLISKIRLRTDEDPSKYILNYLILL